METNLQMVQNFANLIASEQKSAVFSINYEITQMEALLSQV